MSRANSGPDQPHIKHGADCSMSFGRPSPAGDCARCDELRSGAAPRAGWQGAYYERKQREERQWSESLAQHFAPGGPHDSGKCGPVCTFGDW